MNITASLAGAYSAVDQQAAANPRAQSVAETPVNVSNTRGGDQVTLSAQAQEQLPKIDWENRTYKGKPIPDTYFQELTPEMESGEQPYLRSFGSDMGVVYQAVDLTVEERALKLDAEMIGNGLDNIQRLEESVAKTDTEIELLNDAGKHREANMLQHMQSREVFVLEYSKSNLSTFLESSMESYDRLGINMNDAREGILDFSEGRIDISFLMDKYL